MWPGRDKAQRMRLVPVTDIPHQFVPLIFFSPNWAKIHMLNGAFYDDKQKSLFLKGYGTVDVLPNQDTTLIPNSCLCCICCAEYYSIIPCIWIN